MANLISIKEASEWATEYLDMDITRSNVSYLIQYGKIKKYGEDGETLVNKDELKDYYQNNSKTKESSWKKELGDDINWNLSFEKVPERVRTKHVHRLHQYKGKFIPQLVEYFLDDNTDEFKKEVFFKPGDIVLDPFVGSGTALVQANEMGMHGIGIDISRFNCLISQCKLQKYDMSKLKDAITFLTDRLQNQTSQRLFSDKKDSESDTFRLNEKIHAFSDELQDRMNEFNNEYFPSVEFKRKLNSGEIDKDKYTSEKEQEFLEIYETLREKYELIPYTKSSERFLDKWFMDNIKNEMLFIKNYIDKGEDEIVKNLLRIILSKTIRSCRATAHYNLARLKEPQTEPYYCRKHKKICVPLYTLRKKFKRYSTNTLNRIRNFNNLRKDCQFELICGDSRDVNVFEQIENEKLKKIAKQDKIAGVFTSPPYVGQIDYHQQHAYAYELFDFERRDEKEIGPLSEGKSKKARDMYAKGVSETLLNIKPYLKEDYNVLLVANDKFDLYDDIAKNAGMKIIQRFRRPVLKRTSRDRNPYAETIFHMKDAEI